jgi:CheY-like chemotaxis protein
MEAARGTHILLVDDDTLNQRAMLGFLRDLGSTCVDTAWNGAQAVNIVKRAPYSYNCIFLDLTLPVMDGLETASKIREINEDVPRIALIRNASKEAKDASLVKGMNDHITKPIHQERLMQVLWKFLQHD